jgi:hypothetical protein
MSNEEDDLLFRKKNKEDKQCIGQPDPTRRRGS